VPEVPRRADPAGRGPVGTVTGMTRETPRDDQGEPLCAWCGGPIRQSGVGRRRAYCSRTHREYAYRARREEQLLAAARAAAYMEGRADGVRAARAPVPSTDQTRWVADTTVDETRRIPAGGDYLLAPPLQVRRPDGHPSPGSDG
jgi:hypothetical protein